MKITVVLIIGIFFQGFLLETSAQQSRFDEANALLDENSYREAIRVYKSIEEEGYHSGALWLNMGIAYTHIDSLGMAKYYLLRAETYPETRELALDALEYINNRFSRRSAVLPSLPWERFFKFLSREIGLATMVIAALVFFYGGIAFLIGSWFRTDFRKPLRYGAWAVLGISLLIFLCAVVVNYQNNRFGTGVLVDRQSAVYQQPEEESHVVSTAYEGYTMRVDFSESNEEPGWSYVRLENGMYGWVREDAIMVF